MPIWIWEIDSLPADVPLFICMYTIKAPYLSPNRGSHDGSDEKLF